MGLLTNALPYRAKWGSQLSESESRQADFSAPRQVNAVSIVRSALHFESFYARLATYEKVRKCHSFGL